MRLIVFLAVLLLGLNELSAQDYLWLSELDDVETQPLVVEIPTPEGFTRDDVKPGSFAHYLRYLPVRTDRSYVLAHNGKRLSSPSAKVVALDVGKRDLQQCADSIIRLHAEWLWSIGKKDALKYHFTSGDLSTWADYAAGERFNISGSTVKRVNTEGSNHSRTNFVRWTHLIFMYAGTRSLPRDSKPVIPKDIQIGDFFNQAGGPGHAVLILDIARKGDKRVALIGQGFMPAQEFHVVTTPSALDGVWFELPDNDDDLIKTPSWQAFSGSDARCLNNSQF